MSAAQNDVGATTIEGKSASVTLSIPSSSSYTKEDDTDFRCLICLEDKPDSERSNALNCPHPICSPCLSAQWTHAILRNSVAFPKCAVPDCHVYGSDANVSALVEPIVAARMRQLRGLKPARAHDGRRMYCVRDGCYEQLPPPPRPTEEQLQDENYVPNFVTSCPACGCEACMRCGSKNHPGKECVAPLLCRRQKRMYQIYAVGRVTACPRCGVHIERAGGCRSVTCARCGWAFTFSPFRTPEEVAEASDIRDVPPPQVVPVSWANAFGVLLSASFSMVLGAVVSGVFCAYLLEALAKWSFDWFLLLIVPQFIMGIVFFLLGCFSILAICRDLLPQVGVDTPRSVGNVFGIAVLSGTMLVAQFYVRYLLGSSGISIETWQWLLCFLPIIVCNLTLLLLSVSHLIIVTARAINALRRRRGFDHAETEDATPVEDELGNATAVDVSAL